MASRGSVFFLVSNFLLSFLFLGRVRRGILQDKVVWNQFLFFVYRNRKSTCLDLTKKMEILRRKNRYGDSTNNLTVTFAWTQQPTHDINRRTSLLSYFGGTHVGGHVKFRGRVWHGLGLPWLGLAMAWAWAWACRFVRYVESCLNQRVLSQVDLTSRSFKKNDGGWPWYFFSNLMKKEREKRRRSTSNVAHIRALPSYEFRLYIFVRCARWRACRDPLSC